MSNLTPIDTELIKAQISNSNIFIHQKQFLYRHFDKDRTIVFTWTQAVQNHSWRLGKFWGLGDILRGMISLYQYCKARRLTFKVDISHHPLCKYFDTVNNPYFITQPVNNTNFYGGDGAEYTTLEVPHEDNCQVFTNVWPLAPFTDDEQRLIPSILRIKDEYKLNLPTDYNVYHLRFDDNEITCTELTPLMNEMLEKISRTIKPGDILCTNIPLVKRVAKDKYGINTYNDSVNGSHIGYETDDAVNTSVINDYQILSNASNIYTYSIYVWVSGFVQWVAIAYNKPLIDMKSGIRIN
jgi:hypothetical protein